MTSIKGLLYCEADFRVLEAITTIIMCATLMEELLGIEFRLFQLSRALNGLSKQTDFHHTISLSFTMSYMFHSAKVDETNGITQTAPIIKSNKMRVVFLSFCVKHLNVKAYIKISQ